MNKPIGAVLDACVLFPARLMDFMLCLGLEEELYDPYWSNKINEEWSRNKLNKVVQEKRSDAAKYFERRIVNMNKVFPAANCTTYEKHIEKLSATDEKDQHVLAVAIEEEADYLVTFNLKDFDPQECSLYGITPTHPDDFVLAMIERNKNAVIKALKRNHQMYKNPPEDLRETISHLAEKCQLRKSMNALEAML
ncbi:PIN domain-containing protein [Algivirga pacifica]|uniref:PIN domain-containing protein n=1 Tax=Algivirga pacifica TaxID=1162670 RepID=A0ABP9D361_9BACT